LGHAEEAYPRYAISANRAATYLGWFRAVAKKYPDKPPAVVLADLVRHTPGEEGKWFVRTRIRALFDDLATRSGFVASVIGKEVGLD